MGEEGGERTVQIAIQSLTVRGRAEKGNSHGKRPAQVDSVWTNTDTPGMNGITEKSGIAQEKRGLEREDMMGFGSFSKNANILQWCLSVIFLLNKMIFNVLDLEPGNP